MKKRSNSSCDLFPGGKIGPRISAAIVTASRQRCRCPGDSGRCHEAELPRKTRKDTKIGEHSVALFCAFLCFSWLIQCESTNHIPSNSADGVIDQNRADPVDRAGGKDGA